MELNTRLLCILLGLCVYVCLLDEVEWKHTYMDFERIQIINIQHKCTWSWKPTRAHLSVHKSDNTNFYLCVCVQNIINECILKTDD